MAPLVAASVGERGWIVGIGRIIVIDKRCACRGPPRSEGYESAVDLVERQCRRMSFGKVEPACGRQQSGDDLRPATDVGQPDDRPPGNKGDVVLGIEQS